MMLVAEHRTTAKAGAQESASLEGSGNTTVGGQDKRPRGAARLGDGRDIVIARFSLTVPRCAREWPTSRTGKFRNPFNENRTSWLAGDEQG
jgi:hypothetical protein